MSSSAFLAMTALAGSPKAGTSYHFSRTLTQSRVNRELSGYIFLPSRYSRHGLTAVADTFKTRSTKQASNQASAQCCRGSQCMLGQLYTRRSRANSRNCCCQILSDIILTGCFAASFWRSTAACAVSRTSSNRSCMEGVSHQGCSL